MTIHEDAVALRQWAIEMREDFVRVRAVEMAYNRRSTMESRWNALTDFLRMHEALNLPLPADYWKPWIAKPETTKI